MYMCMYACVCACVYVTAVRCVEASLLAVCASTFGYLACKFYVTRACTCVHMCICGYVRLCACVHDKYMQRTWSSLLDA